MLCPLPMETTAGKYHRVCLRHLTTVKPWYEYHLWIWKQNWSLFWGGLATELTYRVNLTKVCEYMVLKMFSTIFFFQRFFSNLYI